jgi:hypothetical protein
MLNPFAKELRAERRAMNVAAVNFIRAAETNDGALFAASLDGWHLDDGFWKQVLRQHGTPHPEFSSNFLALWERNGDALRSSINDDLVLLDLLRWSADREAATCFARNNLRLGINGVLLRTIAPSAAIICAPHALGADRPAEAEYIVDRRQLSGVIVLERFAEIPVILPAISE